MATHFSAQTFEEQVTGGTGLVLVDFWAGWCGPCKMQGPVIDELAGELEGKVLVGKVDIDSEGDLATRFSVMSIPTIILFRDGAEVARLVGVQSKQKLLAMIDKAK